ncbi:hypothetical protein, conserved [Eimeria brunetti]|uniref:Uncharacterized protein n=1 Tax=Eimeria brunetti TaxID=51314 RepID=U6LS49_9EIME|nr:hypothetical protein, conserved [Eimeria brunetti]
MDCGLYGSDWRLILAGSPWNFINPCALLLLRGAAAITHFAMLIWARFYQDMLYFTTWTNLMALLTFWLWTAGSIAALCSLSRQRRQAEAACGSDACGSSATRCSFFSFFRGAHAQYRQLLKEQTELSCSYSASKAPPLRRWFDFRRPFSGSPRRRGLEAFLCLHDIAVSLALPMNIIMFLVYWIMLLPKASKSEMATTVYLHLCCPVATWVLAILSRVPYRLSLFPLTILLGVIYEVMIAIVQSFGFGFVYWFMNFQENPGLACGVSAGLILVLNPATACLAFLVLFYNNAAVVAVED